MSTPATETKPAEEQQVPKAEEKQETTTTSTEAATEPPKGEESSAMEVDASQTETKTEAASGEDAAAKPAEEKPEGEGAKSEEAKPKPDNKFRLSGTARKRFRWLLDQGYSRDEAAELAKEPLKTKELRDRFNADTKRGKKPKDEKVIEAEVKKLNPADKKRFAWLLQNGHTEEEALEVVQKKRATAPKRNLATNGGPAMKMSKPSPDAVGGMIMAVVAKDYPTTTLTHAQSNEVKDAILKEVVQQKDSETKPRFESCAHVKAGYLRVNCCDGTTRQWLHRVVVKLTVPEGISLKLVSEKNLIKGDIYTGLFPDSKKETNEAILEFVKSQNDGLDISKWKVLSRKEPQNKQAIELMFSVDPASSRSIQKLGDELNYKFNKVPLRKQVKSSDSQGQGSNRNVVARTGGRSMGPPQRRPQNQLRMQNQQPRLQNQPRSLSQRRPNSNSFVSVWDSNVSQRSSNFNQFDNMRSNSVSSSNNWGSGGGLNSFGLGNSGNNGYGMDNNSFGNNSFGGSNSLRGSSSFSDRNSFGGGSNSFGSSNSFSNGSSSYGGSNSFGGSSGNLYSRRNGGGGNQSGSSRPFNLSDSLYDQLKLIGSSGGNGNSGNSFGGSSRRAGGQGSSRRTGGGGGNSGNNNSRGRNAGGNSSKQSNRSNSLGNRNFFTTTRTGFF